MAPTLKRPPKKRKPDDSGGSTFLKTVLNSSPPVLSNGANICNFDMRVQQCKKFAVAQSQQEGCIGSYRSFDSPFGNYLLPVIPNEDLFADKELVNTVHIVQQEGQSPCCESEVMWNSNCNA